jgi:dihydrolipoamide dehydrogenase
MLTTLSVKLEAILTNSLKRLKVDTIHGWGNRRPQKVSVIGDSGEKIYTAKDIMLCPGSVPFVPPGI